MKTMESIKMDSKLKVLYIGLNFYHYPKVIAEGLENLGFQVDFFPIEPPTASYKLARYVKKFRKISLDRYHDEIITKSTSVKYDKVFFITTHFFSLENLKRLKETQTKAEFISYHWDSIVSGFDYLNTVPFFDRVFTFDRVDCEEHNFRYLPLFASGIYSSIRQKKRNYDIDVYTVGSVYKLQRYFLVHEFKNFCVKNDISIYVHLHLTLVTYIKLLLKGIIPKNVSLSAIDNNIMEDITFHSRAVLDVPNRPQSGLTMRIIENIAIGKKIVTTNLNIEKEPFYDKNQVFLLGKDNMDGLKEFLELDIEIQERSELMLDSWLKKIFL
ncbi:MAG: hypothetical protein V2A75_03170 [Pseudomonadota bacterium]